MPKVIVYVPAGVWRTLEERGLDPAVFVRDAARKGWEVSAQSIPDPIPVVRDDRAVITVPSRNDEVRTDFK